jgi:hypothetical protein
MIGLASRCRELSRLRAYGAEDGQQTARLPAWMISRAGFLAQRQIVFLVWVTFGEPKWSILAERRGIRSIPSTIPFRRVSVSREGKWQSSRSETCLFARVFTRDQGVTSSMLLSYVDCFSGLFSEMRKDTDKPGGTETTQYSRIKEGAPMSCATTAQQKELEAVPEEDHSKMVRARGLSAVT